MSNGVVVIKIGGSTLEDIGALRGLWTALVGLAGKTGVVIVHGGGKAVDALILRLELPVERREGLRVTPDDQIELIAGVLAGSVNKRLVGAINAASGAAGGTAVGLCLGDAGVAHCQKMTRTSAGTPIELGRVGEVVGGDAALLRTLVDGGYLPVVSSIGIDRAGGLLNINADDAAAGLAGALHATALVLMTDVPGIKDGAGRLCGRLTPAKVEQMIATGEISGGMIPKSRAATRVVVERGVPVVILGAEDPKNLIGWIAGDKVGTEIVPDAAAVAATK